MDLFLEQLKERLLDHDISDKLLNQILSDYQKKIEKNPNSVDDVGVVTEKLIKTYDLKLKEDTNREISTIIAFAPFISIVLYLSLGFLFDLWHPGWLVFIAVPIILLIFSVFHDDISLGFLALIPFIIITSYFFVGFYFGLWHPTWLIFMLLPVIGVFSRYKKRSLKFLLYTLSPFLTISIYIILGSQFHLWSRLWVIFLIVPMLACLEEENRKRLFICEGSLSVALIVGIVTPFFTPLWSLSFIGLAVPLIAMVAMGEDSIIKFKKDNIIDLALFIALSVIYVVLGIVFNAWAYAWMIFLIFPAYEILDQSPNHFKFYYIMPFISIAIFFSLGYFLNGWAYSWTAFLIIPILIFVERD